MDPVIVHLYNALGIALKQAATLEQENAELKKQQSGQGDQPVPLRPKQETSGTG